uniref:Uncharacterized protein n=1 Tax=Anguilla anguilla TaxID=7936 RepID=A0A0E9P7Q2_ANGAN
MKKTTIKKTYLERDLLKNQMSSS